MWCSTTRPDGRTAVRRPPRLLITGVRSFLQESDWKGRSDGIDPRTGLPLGLRLAYRRNYLTFDYTGISLSAPNVRYRYMLVGQDQDWLPVTDARFAQLQQPAAGGEYTFMVIARGRNGRWSDPATFSFHIAPPGGFTWWPSPSARAGRIGVRYTVTVR